MNPSSTLKKTACVAHHQKEMIISDHYIVTTVLKQQRTRASKAIEKVQRHRLLHGFQKVARSPIFDAGRNPELEGRKSEDAVQQFVKALWDLLENKHFVAALKPTIPTTLHRRARIWRRGGRNPQQEQNPGR